jgi:hypothetical protein
VLATALALASRGLHVFPCRPRAKSPATPNGFKAATADPEVIKRWWNENSRYNVAVATGSASSLLVVDADDGLAGEAALEALELAHEPLPASVSVITPGGEDRLPGRHIWLRLPDGSTVDSSAGRLGKRLDHRANGGYVVAPPSVGPLGRR